MEKINELIKRELSLLVQDEFASSLGLIIIQLVETGKDIKNAKVFVSILDKTKNEIAIKKLQGKAFEFQKLLAKKLSTKNIPKLEFVIDESQDKVNRVEELLSVIEKEETK